MVKIVILVNDGHLVAFGTTENDFNNIGRRIGWPRHLVREMDEMRSMMRKLKTKSSSIMRRYVLKLAQ